MSKILLSVELKAEELRNENPNLTEGESLMNALYDVDKTLYEKIINTDLDCSLDSSNVKKFYKEVSLY